MRITPSILPRLKNGDSKDNIPSIHFPFLSASTFRQLDSENTAKHLLSMLYFCYNLKYGKPPQIRLSYMEKGEFFSRLAVDCFAISGLLPG